MSTILKMSNRNLLVDTEDVTAIMQYTWTFNKSYGFRNSILNMNLAKYILGLPKDKVIHITKKNKNNHFT